MDRGTQLSKDDEDDEDDEEEEDEEEEEQEEEQEEEATDIKSNNPHLAGGEKHSVSRFSYLFAHLRLLSSDLFSFDSSPC